MPARYELHGKDITLPRFLMVLGIVLERPLPVR